MNLNLRENELAKHELKEAAIRTVTCYLLARLLHQFDDGLVGLNVPLITIGLTCWWSADTPMVYLRAVPPNAVMRLIYASYALSVVGVTCMVLAFDVSPPLRIAASIIMLTKAEEVIKKVVEPIMPVQEENL